MFEDLVERLSAVLVRIIRAEQAGAQAVVEVLLRQAAATETAGYRSREHYETERRHSARDGMIFGGRAHLWRWLKKTKTVLENTAGTSLCSLF